ncbi:hypothetical protein MKX07_007675 [Trichoderma sp. CBMAI-0711]|nr:hypothetical protein MKX07_007675 [Trichoderma sp. CBMAI-0711]
MPGPIACEVIALIGDSTSKFQSINEIHGDIESIEGLLSAFKNVGRHIPVVCKALEAAKQHIRQKKDDGTCAEMKPSVEGCKDKATNLAVLFTKVVPRAADERMECYRLAVRELGERSRVETLMKDAMEDVQNLLTVDEEMQAATGSYLEELSEALKVVSAIPPSLQDESSSLGIYNYGSGPQNVNTGTGPQNNNNGSGAQINGDRSRQAITMSLRWFIGNHGGGLQNVKTGDGSQFNNNDSGLQFNNSHFYGVGLRDPRAEEAERLKKEKEDCLLSLSYQTMDARRIDISSAHPETCDWIFDTEQFLKWHSRAEFCSHNGVLWVKGNPGTGKSTLMKHIFENCERKFFEKHLIAAHFFNARGDSFEQTPLGMLRSILYQLVDQEPSIYEHFVPMFREKQRKYREWEWRDAELEKFLLSETQRCSRPMLLLIDALDECSESHVRKVVQFLEDLSIKTNAPLNICLSSRHYPNITMKKHLQLVVETTRQHNEDIAVYVRKRLTYPDEDIKRELLENASGVFLWVVLVVEMLNKAYDEGQLEAMHKKLNDVPRSLDELFQALLTKDNAVNQETVFMLVFVLLTRRLLRPEELYFATMTHIHAENIGPWDSERLTQDDIRRRIIYSSRGLLEIQQGETRTVQFIHKEASNGNIRDIHRFVLADSADDVWPEVVEVLIQKEMIAEVQWVLDSALVWTVMDSMEELVKILLEKGANPNGYNGILPTALGLPVSSQQEEVMALLIENGANVNNSKLQRQ